jgi:hypothetical protein
MGYDRTREGRHTDKATKIVVAVRYTNARSSNRLQRYKADSTTIQYVQIFHTKSTTLSHSFFIIILFVLLLLLVMSTWSIYRLSLSLRWQDLDAIIDSQNGNRRFRRKPETLDLGNRGFHDARGKAVPNLTIDEIQSVIL